MYRYFFVLVHKVYFHVVFDKQQQTRLVTSRLALNPLDIKDSEFILSLVNTEGWLKFIGDRNVHSIPDAESYVQNIISNPDVLYWVVRSHEQTHAVGIITLIKRKDLEYPDLGFAFLPAAAGNGYAFEACTAVLSHILGGDEIGFLNAITNQKNKSSIRLLEKLGFKFVGEKTTEKDTVQLYGAEADKIQISLRVHAFFSAFTNKHSDPCLDTLHDLCLPQALIISKQRSKTDVMSLQSFIEPREKLLTGGPLLQFEEKEISQETKIAGEIAQRYSKYKKKGILNGQPFETYGHKFFQLVKLNGVWKISSVVWADE